MADYLEPNEVWGIAHFGDPAAHERVDALGVVTALPRRTWRRLVPGVFVLGLICALPRIGRNAFGTLAIVMLVARAEPAWMIAIHRFLEIPVGIAVGWQRWFGAAN